MVIHVKSVWQIPVLAQKSQRFYPGGMHVISLKCKTSVILGLGYHKKAPCCFFEV